MRWALTFLILVPSLAFGQTSKKPNVLFIIADDLNRHLPCYGHPEVRTPNIDRLAAKSTIFERAYCQYPVCSPSRVSFLSGLRPERTEMYGNDGASRTPALKDAVFVPELLRKSGYFTARVGKVFHIGRDVPECWDVTEEGTPGNRVLYQPSEIEKLGLTDKVKATGRLKGGGGEGNSWSILDTPDDSLIDGLSAKRTAALLDDAAKGEKPFFIACGFRRPHLPRMGPSCYFESYPLDRIALPVKSPVQHPLIQESPSEADTREALRSYFACVSFMDAQLGKLLDQLDQKQLWDNTIVVLIGDHGYALGSRGGWWGKGQGYEDCCGTTLLLHTPGQKSSQRCSRVVEFVDFYPTLADLCGVKAPAGQDGRSLRTLLENPKAEWAHPAFSITAKNGQPTTLAVSTERFRLISHYDGTGANELYDLQADPNEWANLAESKDHRDTLQRLQQIAMLYRQSLAKPAKSPSP